MHKSQLFKRQTTLQEIGEEGQEKLQKASVVIVGCGGLGSAIAVYLATSGLGKIHLIDFDIVAISNLHRQVFYELDDVGKPKAQILANFIQKRAPFTEVTFSNKPLVKNNVLETVTAYDIVVDATDSLPTKYLLNDACVLQQKPLVYGSLYKFDGYVASFNILQKEGSYSANLRDAFPEMATDIPNCEEAGTLNAIVGIIALTQVNEVLKLITNVGKPLVNELLIYNSLENSQLKMKVKPKYDKAKIQEIFQQESYFDASCTTQNSDWLITASALKKELSKEEHNLHLIAVLSNLELPFKVDETIPINTFNPEAITIDESKTYVMVCQKGLNSYKATELFKAAHPKIKVLSLEGGISSY